MGVQGFQVQKMRASGRGGSKLGWWGSRVAANGLEWRFPRQVQFWGFTYSGLY